MNAKKLLALWGLKWNPFSPDLPSEALLVTAPVEHFAWRVEQLVQEGGFALVWGESGTGKSVALRIVAERLAALRDVVVGVLERPQSKTADFYRELREIFSVKLSPSNRYGGFKALRERWRAHLSATHIKPVLLIDEAQEMAPEVLSELRLLSSADFDATSLLTMVLSGDDRLLERLRHPDLVPLATRIRTRLHTEAVAREQLAELLHHGLAKAGNASLMTAELIDTLVDHAAGNYRLLMTLGGELLAYGISREVAQKPCPPCGNASKAWPGNAAANCRRSKSTSSPPRPCGLTDLSTARNSCRPSSNCGPACCCWTPWSACTASTKTASAKSPSCWPTFAACNGNSSCPSSWCITRGKTPPAAPRPVRARHFSVHIAKRRYYCPKCRSHGNHLELWAVFTKQPLHPAMIDLCHALRREIPWIRRW